MSRVDAIEQELRASDPNKYVYWTDEIELAAGRKGQDRAHLTHLRVPTDNRRDGIATDGIIALVRVLEDEGFQTLTAEVGATNIPDDGSPPPYDDPTARFLRLASFEDVDPVQPTESDTEWAFTGRRRLHPRE